MNSSNSNIKIVSGLIIAAVLILLGIKTFTTVTSDRSTFSKLDTNQYFNSYSTIQGQQFSTDVTFISTIDKLENSSLVLARTTNTQEPLLLLLPNAISIPFTPNQTYSVDLLASQNTILVLTSITKK